MAIEQDIRLSALELYQARMADVVLSRHPLRRDALVCIQQTHFDIYQDGSSEELVRVLKSCVFKKAPDLYYVQEGFGDSLLVEDVGNLPWMVMLTCLGLPRIPMTDDKMIIEGKVYTVSAVRPTNREVQGVLECAVYPERVDVDDPLSLYGVSFSDGLRGLTLEDSYGRSVVVRILWGGHPVEMSWDKSLWVPFRSISRMDVPVGVTTFHIRDVSGVTRSLHLGGFNVPLVGFSDQHFSARQSSAGGGAFLFPSTEFVYA